jgi:two-component system, LytTR family, response regulator
MHVLIVDDEPLARAHMRALLAEDPDIRNIDECATGMEAVSAIRTRRPDLVLLDVEMPELDGFGVIRTLGVDQMPPVIFVTAYNQYAARAFDVHAVDYVLKPVWGPRFTLALDRAKARVNNQATQSVALDQARSRLSALIAEITADTDAPVHLEMLRVGLKTEGRVRFVRPSDIEWLEAENNYVRVHIGREIHYLRATLGDIESRLPADGFLRIHRSVVVNVDWIREIRSAGSTPLTVVLANGTRLAVGRRYRTVVAKYRAQSS